MFSSTFDPAEPIASTSITTPVGKVWIAYRGRTVLRVGIGERVAAFRRAVTAQTGVPPRVESAPAWARDALLTALQGKRPRVQVDLSGMTPFQRRVLSATTAIRPGATRSYAKIATAAGAPGAARAAGTALARNPAPLLIPCHRVARGDGEVGAYSAGGPSMKQRLLRREGARSWIERSRPELSQGNAVSRISSRDTRSLRFLISGHTYSSHRIVSANTANTVMMLCNPTDNPRSYPARKEHTHD